MADYQLAASHPLEAEGPSNEQGHWQGGLLKDLFRVPTRYLRSVHLEQDFCEAATLSNYIITPSTAASFRRLIDAVVSGSTNRAWRITGDFGTGKSSLALVYAHLFTGQMSPDLDQIRQGLKQYAGVREIPSTRLLPLLVTGTREPFVPAVARGIARALEQLRDDGGCDKDLCDLMTQSTITTGSGDPSALRSLLGDLNRYSVSKGFSGVLLVLDELGKFLEYAAFHPEQEDVYVLQALAEDASRSGDYPLVLMALLHQNISAYAQGLPSTSRLEWAKVAGRFDEITLDQPLAHVAALVSGALNIDSKLIPSDVTDTAHAIRTATLETGWYGASPSYLSPLEMYPLHPTVLPVLVRFFARFGQHERSLFSFLLSSEPYGLQAFAERGADQNSWYRLSDFYDYVRVAFGDNLAGGSYSSDWLRIMGTLDRFQHMVDVNPLELQIMKVVALLNVLDAEHLLPTQPVIEAALTDGDPEGLVFEALTSLKQQGFLFDRGMAGGYRLWPSTSVALGAKFEAAKREIGPIDQVSSLVIPYLEKTSVVARRHYIETGTLRHFEVRYADLETLPEKLEAPVDSDGVVLVLLCDSSEQRQLTLQKTLSCGAALRPEVIVAVPPALQGISGEVVDVLCWQWVADNTPELNQDSYAAAEVARQLTASRRLLVRRLNSICGFRDEYTASCGVQWWYLGQRIDVPEHGGISTVVSRICETLYCDAPKVHNELLNRRVLSSAAASARLRLIDRMFSSYDEPMLGLGLGKAPPEKSMYLSVLKEGNVHREEGGQFVIAEPPEGMDPLRLRPALRRILGLLENAEGDRVSVKKIFDDLNDYPYGVRSGLAPLLLAVEIVANAHEIAIYENGTFQHQVDSYSFMRIIKEPSTFELQLCKMTGARAEVLSLLGRSLTEEDCPRRDYNLLDVVRPLSIFAAQLPEYTQVTPALEEPAGSIRDALLTAREPAPLLFETLPIACGIGSITPDDPSDELAARRFVDRLESALRDLASTYPNLLERIRRQVFSGLSSGGKSGNRAETTERAARIVLSAREPRFQAFARCLADLNLSDDGWAERIGSFAISKPPSKWTYAEEMKAASEIKELTEMFLRVEAASFACSTDEPGIKGIRLGFTQSDGLEAARVVYVRSEDEPIVSQLALEMERVLRERPDLKLAAISQVLWRSLAGNSEGDEPSKYVEPIQMDANWGGTA